MPLQTAFMTPPKDAGKHVLVFYFYSFCTLGDDYCQTSWLSVLHNVWYLTWHSMWRTISAMKIRKQNTLILSFTGMFRLKQVLPAGPDLRCWSGQKSHAADEMSTCSLSCAFLLFGGRSRARKTLDLVDRTTNISSFRATADSGDPVMCYRMQQQESMQSCQPFVMSAHKATSYASVFYISNSEKLRKPFQQIPTEGIAQKLQGTFQTFGSVQNELPIFGNGPIPIGHDWNRINRN